MARGLRQRSSREDEMGNLPEDPGHTWYVPPGSLADTLRSSNTLQRKHKDFVVRLLERRYRLLDRYSYAYGTVLSNKLELGLNETLSTIPVISQVKSLVEFVQSFSSNGNKRKALRTQKIFWNRCPIVTGFRWMSDLVFDGQLAADLNGCEFRGQFCDCQKAQFKEVVRWIEARMEDSLQRTHIALMGRQLALGDALYHLGGTGQPLSMRGRVSMGKHGIEIRGLEEFEEDLADGLVILWYHARVHRMHERFRWCGTKGVCEEQPSRQFREMEHLVVSSIDKYIEARTFAEVLFKELWEDAPDALAIEEAIAE